MDATTGVILRHLTNCPSCGGGIRPQYRLVRDRFDTVRSELSVDACRDCSLRFTNPQPVRNLDHLYPELFLSSHSAADRQSGVATRLERWYRTNQYDFDFRLFTRSTGLQPSSIPSYLDIGCGTGDRLAFIRSRGCPKVFGIDSHDYFHVPLDKESHYLQTDILDFVPPEPYAVVSLFHVLEHLPDFPVLLRHIVSSMIQPGGYLLLQVPNFGSLERRIFASRWFGLDVPRHLWHFGPAVLEGALQHAGMEAVGVYGRNATLHPVSLAPSFCRELDIQRIWVRSSVRRASATAVLKLAWILATLASVPLSFFQSLFDRGSMLTVIARRRS